MQIVDPGCGVGRVRLDGGRRANKRSSSVGRRALIAGSDGVTILWDVDAGKEIATLYCFKDGIWAVTDAPGRFDTGDIEGNTGLNWVAYSHLQIAWAQKFT